MKSKTKRIVTIWFSILMLFTLSLQGCILGDPNAHMDPILKQLIEAEKQGNAEEYAQAHPSIDLMEDGVLVVIEPEPGKFEQALKVTSRYGTVIGSSAKINEIGARVPVKNLIPLVEDSSIQSIGLPPHTVLP